MLTFTISTEYKMKTDGNVISLKVKKKQQQCIRWIEVLTWYLHYIDKKNTRITKLIQFILRET